MSGITYSTAGSFGAFRSIRPGEYPYTEARLKRHKMEEPDIEEEEESNGEEDEPERTERSRILRAVGRYIQTQYEEHGLSALGVNGTVYAVEDILQELDAIIREEEGEG